MLDSTIKARQRLAEVDTLESEVVQHGRCRSTIRGKDAAEVLKLRAFVNELHNRALSNSRGEIR